MAKSLKRPVEHMRNRKIFGEIFVPHNQRNKTRIRHADHRDWFHRPAQSVLSWVTCALRLLGSETRSGHLLHTGPGTAAEKHVLIKITTHARFEKARQPVSQSLPAVRMGWNEMREKSDHSLFIFEKSTSGHRSSQSTRAVLVGSTPDRPGAAL